jgi:photosystem II stability/assembly factor-like uncharacterized protein
MYKKIYLLLVFSGFISLGIINAQWVIEKSPSKNNLNSVYLTDSKSGWIVGNKGTILYNKDNSWFQYSKVTDENLNSVIILDSSNGWAVGSKGTILHFDGKDWEKIASPTIKDLYSVSFSDTENGIAVGAWGAILLYKDGIWTVVDKAISYNLFSVSSKNGASVVSGDLENHNVPFMMIENNTESTLTKSFYPFAETTSIAWAGKDNIWAVGLRGTIFHFDGRKWTKFETNKTLISLKHVYFSDGNNGISVGYNGTILTYSDNNWLKQNSPVKVNLNGSAISGTTYYAVGDNGTIVSRKQSANNVLTSDMQNKTMKIEVYPNPSNELLKFSMPSENDFSKGLVTITNIYGQLVIQKRIDPGILDQICQINTSDLKNGLYSIKMITPDGQTTASGKFIVKH